MGKIYVNRYFFKKDVADKHMKRCSISVAMRERRIKNHNETPLHTTRITVYQQDISKNGVKSETSYIVVIRQSDTTALGKCLAMPWKVRHRVTI